MERATIERGKGTTSLRATCLGGSTRGRRSRRSRVPPDLAQPDPDTARSGLTKAMKPFLALRSLALLLFPAIVACSAPSAGAGTEAAAGTATAAAQPPAQDRAHTLALAKATGGDPVDREIDMLQRRLDKTPGKADSWVQLGRAWVKKARQATDPGYYLSASACADIALEIEPDHKLALELQALVLLNDHRFRDAVAKADLALAKDGEDILALGVKSDALLELGRYPEATRAAQQMMDLKPSLPSYSRAAHLRWLAGDTLTAKQIVRQAIDARDHRDPEPGAWVIVQAAMMFLSEGDEEGADKGFELALQTVPEYPPALVGRGRVALAAGDAKRAAELFERAYKQSLLVETAWLLGDARAAAGDRAGAEEAYALVVKDGRRTDGRTLAAFYATKNRDIDEAVRLALAEREVRDDLYTEDTIAWSLYRAGKLDEARKASEQALSLGTKDAKLLYHAGAIRIAQGDVKPGAALVREALKLHPKFDPTAAPEAESLLATLPPAKPAANPPLK
jgi:tetratricopeptide (TPR) repeat protein